MHRRRMSRRHSRHVFRRGAMHIKKRNMARPMRGGFRI